MWNQKENIPDEMSNIPQRDRNRFTRLSYPDSYMRTIIIDKFEAGPRYNEQGRSMRYFFTNAYPYSIDAVPLDAGTATLLNCSVNFYYERFEVQFEARGAMEGQGLWETISSTESKGGPEYQRQGNPTDFYNVQKFLGIEVEKRGVYVDAAEDDNIYISLDKAEIISSMRVCKAVCSKFYLTESMLLRTVNNINRGQWTSLEWAIKDRAIYGIKIPMDLRSGKEVKIYSIPFFRNNGYVFDQPTLDFIDKLFNGEYEKHKEHIHEQVYVAEEPETGRHVLFFQRNQVLTSSSK